MYTCHYECNVMILIVSLIWFPVDKFSFFLCMYENVFQPVCVCTILDTCWLPSQRPGGLDALTGLYHLGILAVWNTSSSMYHILILFMY